MSRFNARRAKAKWPSRPRTDGSELSADLRKTGPRRVASDDTADSTNEAKEAFGPFQAFWYG
jgi:hypothetical protein